MDDDDDDDEDGTDLDDGLSDDDMPYGFNPFTPGGMRFGFGEEDLEEVFVSDGRGGGPGAPECQQQ